MLPPIQHLLTAKQGGIGYHFLYYDSAGHNLSISGWTLYPQGLWAGKNVNRTYVSLFQSFLLTQSQQSTLLKTTTLKKWFFNFCDCLFLKVWPLFLLTCMSASVYILPKWRHLGKIIHLEFSIGHPIFPKSGLNRVFVAYFLCHYLETMAMNIGHNWQPSWKMAAILNFF